MNRALAVAASRRSIVGRDDALENGVPSPARGFDSTTRIGADTNFAHRAVFVGPIRNHQEPLYCYLERSQSLTQSPSTGLDSDLRRAYQAKFRRRFHANLLRPLSGTLRVKHLQAPLNDVASQLNYLENGQSAR